MNSNFASEPGLNMVQHESRIVRQMQYSLADGWWIPLVTSSTARGLLKHTRGHGIILHDRLAPKTSINQVLLISLEETVPAQCMAFWTCRMKSSP